MNALIEKPQELKVDVKKHTARKRFGQNFLINKEIIFNLVACVNPQVSDCLIEIGPGLGALTYPLLAGAKKMTVIELDRDLVESLSRVEGLSVINQDVLKVDFFNLHKTIIDINQNDISENNINQEDRLRVVGNLPYNISTPIIFHLLKARKVVKDMHFMLQKEVVERMAAMADTPEYGRLSVMVQRYCAVTPLLMISPECFNPAPKVMSQFVKLTPYLIDPFEIIDDVLFENIVRAAFANRRKMLRNNLKKYFATEDFAACNIDPQARAETLSPVDFARLSNYVSNNPSNKTEC